MKVVYLIVLLLTIIVQTTPATAITSKLSESIGSIVIGPVPGEYGYELKLVRDKWSRPMNAYYNDRNKAQIIGVIEKIKRDYPNAKRIGIVIGWYGDTVNAGKITILPKVDSNRGPDWEVAGYSRRTAAKLKVDLEGNPYWSGTPTDKSVVELTQHLHSLGYEVTIYPFIFIDKRSQPWRGYIKATSDADVEHFFDEYNKFILHYASLEYNGVKLKDVIEGFLLGSELEALTKYRSDKTRKFLVTEKLVDLAAQVRAIVGKKVKLSYAANWSEYHSDKGWYHLDKLWQDKNIDYVGIDAYFPLTTHIPTTQKLNPELIEEGWESGENYEYYDDNGVKKKLSPEYAIENIRYWWLHRHKNPDGSVTGWKPRMKPIMFYEVGFTAISRTTNSPYSYFNKLRADLGLPKGSSGKLNPRYQYDAVLATTNFVDRINKGLDGKKIVAHKFWWNIDPKGRSPDWIHNHELKIAEFERGEFDAEGRWKGRKRGWWD